MPKISGTLGYCVERIKVERQKHANNEAIVTERIIWQEMHQDAIDNGGSWDQ